jgi:hypothetical protein
MILVSGARTSSAGASNVQIRLNADSGSNYNSFGSLITNTGTLGTMLDRPCYKRNNNSIRFSIYKCF